ncbi:MAG: acyl-CoA reductase [Bacteroidota bacterium]
MNIEQRINAFIELGRILDQSSISKPEAHLPTGRDEAPLADNLHSLIKSAHHYNGWFTEENVSFAIGAIAQSLREENIRKWLETYKNRMGDSVQSHRIGVVMAGNIPLVGFHDFLCVLMSGNIFVGKTSSKDHKILSAVADALIEIAPDFKEYIEFSEEHLGNIDAIIATGSDNTSRYFEYYFGKYPNIIRRNRNSIAVIDGNETQNELKELARDIFQYFGLGCRNVSKLFVPDGYDFDKFFNAIAEYKYVTDHNKYSNNYDYCKTIYLMNQTSHLDNGFLLLKEDTKTASPVAALFYEYYSNIEMLIKRLKSVSDNVQCIVSTREKLSKSSKLLESCIPFGQSQQPQLWDYADGVDTMSFLISL